MMLTVLLLLAPLLMAKPAVSQEVKEGAIPPLAMQYEHPGLVQSTGVDDIDLHLLRLGTSSNTALLLYSIWLLYDSPRNTSLDITPTGPVSVGSMVNLTCSCSRHRPVHFVWFMVSDGRLELISADTKVYSFNLPTVIEAECSIVDAEIEFFGKSHLDVR